MGLNPHEYGAPKVVLSLSLSPHQEMDLNFETRCAFNSRINRPFFFHVQPGENRKVHGDLMGFYGVYPLLNVYITNWKIIILNGKTHHVYGHLP